MSVLDQLRSLEQQVLERMRELRPLVEEYRDLEQVAERLGLRREDDEPSGADASAAPQAAKREPTRKPRAKRAPRRSKRAAARKPEPAAATKPKPKASAATAPAASKVTPQPAPATASAAPKPKPKASAESSTAAAKPASARTGKAKSKPSARTRSAAAPGQREQDVLRLVGEQPGVTVRELAAALGVDATGLYGVVRRLEGRGQLTKNGTQLRLASVPGATETPAADTPASTSGSGPASDATSAEEPALPPTQQS